MVRYPPLPRNATSKTVMMAKKSEHPCSSIYIQMKGYMVSSLSCNVLDVTYRLKHYRKSAGIWQQSNSFTVDNILIENILLGTRKLLQSFPLHQKRFNFKHTWRIIQTYVTQNYTLVLATFVNTVVKVFTWMLGRVLFPVRSSQWKQSATSNSSQAPVAVLVTRRKWRGSYGKIEATFPVVLVKIKS